MTEMKPGTYERPRNALDRYVDELHHAYYMWYEKSVQRVHFQWITLQIVSILVGFAAAVLAAAVPEDRFNGPWRATLIILPIIGSLASSALLQFRVYDLWKLREDGRIRMQSLVAEGRRRSAAAASPDECTQIHQELQAKADEIERSQSESFFTLAGSDFVARLQSPPASPRAAG